jgi:mRNA interferase MazF
LSFRFRLPQHRQNVGGLSQESVALCHQITTLDRAKLQEKIGELSIEWIQRIEEGLKAATDLL